MSVVDEIKQRLDIVDLIGSYVSLQKAGRNYKAVCPFHSEKTPSFVVFPDTQTWHCFGACSTGGDLFGFVMRRENMDFSEALRLLAEKAGINLLPLDQEELRQKDDLDRLRAANASAAEFYHRLLMEADRAQSVRDYLQRRGVTRETMATFQLGYAPDEWHALDDHLKREHFAVDDCLEAGLLSRSDSGNIYDRFRGRLMFPIRDIQGHVIGFGGRVLDDSVPKYLNTPQSPLFDKGSVLYGIDLAHRSIRDSGTAIIVEGYMDVIVPYQCGVTNLVGCLGTALTDAHIKTLKRSTKTLILALDPDEAGLTAMERGVQVAREGLDRKVVPVPTAEGLIRYEEQLDAEIRVMTLPDGLDPDELILQDRARWDQLVGEALPVAEYFFRRAQQMADMTTAKGKRQLVDRLLPVLAAMDNPVERTHYLQRLAQLVRVDERDLQTELDGLRGEKARRPVPVAKARVRHQAAGASPQSLSMGLEERSLSLLLQNVGMLRRVVETTGLSAEVFTDIRNKQVFQALEELGTLGPEEDIAEALAGLDTELRVHVQSLLQRLQNGPPLSLEMLEEDVLKCSARLRKDYLARLIQELRFVQQEAQEEGAEERVHELNQRIEQVRRDYLAIDQGFYAVTLVGRKHSRGNPIVSGGS
ncbi:MAG: DNA primase [Chloroflexi bacterium]|jgi:DNA primase|nr:DNA primase [Chloroflexota bacterium]